MTSPHCCTLQPSRDLVVSSYKRALAGCVLFQMLVLVRPISSRDRSFGPNRSGPRKKKKKKVRVTAYMLFQLPAKDLHYAEVNHVN